MSLMSLMGGNESMIDEEDWTLVYMELVDEAYKIRSEKNEKYGYC